MLLHHLYANVHRESPHGILKPTFDPAEAVGRSQTHLI